MAGQKDLKCDHWPDTAQKAETSLQFYGPQPQGAQLTLEAGPRGGQEDACHSARVTKGTVPAGCQAAGRGGQAWHEDPYYGQLPLPCCRQAEEPA